ncbi:hypothetical protein EB822_08600 [Flavobacteriaceae bacterium PRS1]|nr:hypothetical protein EB822_08600 [Flavobacteriaceae bacterium PRS1]
MFEENDDDFKSHEDIQKMPVYKKAMELLKLVDYISETVLKTDIKFEDEIEAEMINRNVDYLCENALIIPAKIAGAEAVDIYDLKMENAAIIRKAARELITDTRGIEMHGFKDTEYLDLLRNEVEEFRVLFAEWVKTFNCWDYIIDRWRLFNPPGINYDDKDSDDDIPFQNPFDDDKF